MTTPCRPGCDNYKSDTGACCAECLAKVPPALREALRDAPHGSVAKQEAARRVRRWLLEGMERQGTAVMGEMVQMLPDIEHDWVAESMIGGEP